MRLKLPFFGKKKEKVKVNFGGKIYIAFTLLVGFAAVNSGNNILYILLSFLLSLMGISGFLSRYNLKGLEVYFYPPEEVWCCKPTKFSIGIRNFKRFPSFLIEVFEEKIGLKLKFDMVKDFSMGETYLTFPKRGKYKIGKLKLKSTFPFGLFERSWEIETDEEVLVFPKPMEVEIPKALLNSTRSKKEGYLDLRVRRVGGEVVEGVKEYSGEGFRLIHWKAFAKYGELYAKELSGEELIREVIIDLDSIPASDKEERISKATYLVLKFSKIGYGVGIKQGDTEITPSYGREHFKKLLEFLALL